MVYLTWIVTALLILPLSVQAGNPKGINISGRLVESVTNLSLSSSGVDFTLKVLSPNNCLLYEERHLNKDLSVSGGSFSLTLGEGTSAFNAYASVIGEEQSRENLLKVFSNSSSGLAGLQSEAQGIESTVCSGTYTPVAGDVRKVKIVFDPGTGTPRAILPFHKIGTVPYAMVAEESAKSADSDRLGGEPAANFAKVSDLGTAIPANETDPSVRAFAKAALPNCSAGQVLKSDGTSFSCVSDATGGSAAVATTTSTGVVQVGTGLAVDGAGVLSVASLPISQVTGLQTALNDRLSMSSLPECLADQTMTWVSATDTMMCVNISLTVSDVSDFVTAVDARISSAATASPKLPLAGGTMTGDLNMGGRDVLSTGHITMNPGKTLLMSNLSQAQEDALVLTAAHKGLSWYNTDLKALRLYDGAAKLTVSASVGACSDGQILKWNNGTKVWDCGNDAGAGGADASTIRAVNVDITGMSQGNFLQYNGTSFVDMAMPVCTANQVLSFTALGVASCAAISGLTDSAIAAGAAIARSKIAAVVGAANHVLINDGLGSLSSEAQLAPSRGGTGQSTYTAGQLLIGKSDGTLAKATLTAGTNISISNGDGTVTINSTVDGATLTNLNASNLSSGTVSSSLLPVVPLNKGGTGATTALAARTNLELGSAAEVNIGSSSGSIPLLGFGGLAANKACVADGTGSSIVCTSDMVTSINGLSDASTAGTRNVFLGQNSGGLLSSGSDNTAVGFDALKNVTTGGNNVAIGTSAMYSLTNNYSNVAIGDGAAYSNNGTRNVVVGSWAFDGNTIGVRNTVLGEGALGDSTTGDDNVAVGQGAGNAAEEGSRNVFLGTAAGTDAAKRPLHENILIGYDAQVPSDNKSNFLNIGNTIFGDLSTSSVGVGQVSPAAKLDVNGGIRLGNDAGACNASRVGVLKYVSSDLYLCTGVDWVALQKQTSAGALFAGFPDIIKCSGDDGSTILLPNETVDEGSRIVYVPVDSYGNDATIEFDVATGAQVYYYDENWSSWMTSCQNKSISQLVTDGQTFMFTSGGNSTWSVTGGNLHRLTGSVGIGTSTPGYKLDVQGGDINASGSVRAAGVALTSDIRYKRDVASIDNALEKILNLRGVTYDWRQEDFPEKHFTDRRQLGVIAQEVEREFPEAVDTDKSGYKSVNYPALVAPLIEAVREIYESLTGTQADVAALKAENEMMKTWICQRDPQAPFCLK